MPLGLGQRYGKTSGAFASFDNSGANVDNEIGTAAVLGPQCAHRIYRLSAFFAGDGVTVAARLAAWWQSQIYQSANSLSKHSPSFTAPSGSHATGGQTLNAQYADAIGGQAFAGSGNFICGWWRTEAASAVWSVTAAGTFIHLAAADDSNIGAAAACGGAYICGDIQAYFDTAGGDLKSLVHGFPIFRAGRRGSGRR